MKQVKDVIVPKKEVKPSQRPQPQVISDNEEDYDDDIVVAKKPEKFSPSKGKGANKV